MGNNLESAVMQLEIVDGRPHVNYLSAALVPDEIRGREGI
jgi:hypothetical protein